MSNDVVEIKSDTELRNQRIKIYCDSLKNAPCTKGAIVKALGIDMNVPDEGMRWYYFKQLVEKNILRDYDIYSEEYQFTWPKVGLESSKAYQALADYAKTPFGAVMVRRILADNSIPAKKRFMIKRFDNDSARGGSDYIRFPINFPRKEILLTGERVDTQAIIHHEFGHTRYFFKHKRGKEVTLPDERDAVIYMENPVRMYKNNEPRYSYYNDNDEDPKTINIITGDIKSGIWTTDKSDPRKMIQGIKK